MISFTDFLFENAPWESHRDSIFGSIQNRRNLPDTDMHGRGCDRPSQLVRDALIRLVQTPHRYHLIKFYDLLLNTKIDPDFFLSPFQHYPYFMEQIEILFKTVPESDIPNAAVVGEWLARFSPDKSMVKWGILFLGYFRNFGCKELIMTLGSHEEFTLFAIETLQALYENPEQDIWHLAKAVTGKSRQIAVEQLKETDSSETKRWMIYEGFKEPCTYRNYRLASIYAKAGNLLEHLKHTHANDALLEGAGMIIAELLRSKGDKQDRYLHELEATQLFLQHIVKAKITDVIKRTLYAIQHSLTKIGHDSSGFWVEKGWTQSDTIPLLKSIEAILKEHQPTLQKLSYPLASKPACLIFHPTDPQVFIAETSGKIIIFDFEKDDQIFSFSTGKALLLTIGFYCGFLYSFDEAHQLKKWDKNTGECLERYSITLHPDPEHILAIFVPNTQYLVISYCGEFHDPIQIDIESGCKTGSYPCSSGSEGREIVSFVPSRDGSQLSAGMLTFYGSWGPTHFNYLIEQWNLADCQKTCCYSTFNWRENHAYDAEDFVPRQAFSPDGSRLLVSFDGEFSLWETSQESDEGKEWLGCWEAGEIAWSPVSDIIAFGRDPGGKIAFLDISTKKILFQEQLFEKAIEHLEFSPDGRYLAAFSADSLVEIYEINFTGKS